MKLLKNRGVAIAITAIVVFAAVLFGVNRSLNKLANNIERMFYEGVYIEDGKYTQPSIHSKLEQCGDQALGISTIITNHPQFVNDADALILLRRELIAADGIEAKSRAFGELSEAVARASRVLAGADLPQDDIDSAADYITRFNSAKEFITNTAYNDEAFERWNKRSYIARFFALLVPTRAPGMF